MAQDTVKNNNWRGGPRAEIKVRLGQATITRYKRHFAEGDYSQIAERITPKPLRQLVSKNLKAAAKNPQYVMAASLAQGIQAYYKEKEELEKSLAS